MSVFRVSVLGLVGLLTACDGPLLGHDCNLMYAPSGVGIELHQPSWDEGAWVFEAEGAGEVHSCGMSLPLVDGLAPCDGIELTYDEEAGIVDFFVLEWTPAQVEFRAYHDDVQVFVESVQPSYAEDEPNGEGCGVRRQFTAAADL